MTPAASLPAHAKVWGLWPSSGMENLAMQVTSGTWFSCPESHLERMKQPEGFAERLVLLEALALAVCDRYGPAVAHEQHLGVSGLELPAVGSACQVLEASVPRFWAPRGQQQHTGGL